MRSKLPSGKFRKTRADEAGAKALWSFAAWCLIFLGVAAAVSNGTKSKSNIALPAAEAARLPFRERLKRRASALWSIVTRVIERASRDNLSLVAAGVAFYAMFAIFPALGALVSIYGLFGDAHIVQSQVQQLTALLPPETGKLINDALSALLAKPSKNLNFGLLVSLGVAVWGARAGTSSLIAGLNIACNVPETRSFWLSEAAAIGFVFGAILFAIVALTTVAIIPLVISYLPVDSQVAAWLNFSRWPVLAAFILLALDVIYRFGPSQTAPRWRFISTGTLFAAIVWIAGSWAFSTYVTRFGRYDVTYGSLGAVVVLLLWFWLSALIVLLGATVDAVLGEIKRERSVRG